jgi:hypothetical protein
VKFEFNDTRTGVDADDDGGNTVAFEVAGHELYADRESHAGYGEVDRDGRTVPVDAVEVDPDVERRT